MSEQHPALRRVGGPTGNARELRALIEQTLPAHDDPGNGAEDGDRLEPVDWRIFLPSPQRAVRDGEFDYDIWGGDWDPDFPEEWIGQIEEALGSGPLVVGPEAACGTPGTAHRCAWYVPLRASRSGFGIYIREMCVLERAVRIAGALPKRPATSTLLQALYRAATFQLFLHEQFHHKVESFGFRLLVVEDRTRYLDYQAKVYRKMFGTNACLEEALANADAYRRLRESAYLKWLGPTIVDAARTVLEMSWMASPPGYNQAGSYLSAGDNAAGLALLKAQVREAVPRPRRIDPFRISANLAESIFPIAANIYTVLPVGGRPIMPIR